MNQPVRAYPLRTVNEPGVFVAGEKSGQKSYPPGGPMQMHGSSGPSTMPTAPIGMAMNFSQQQAMLAQQNSNMEALERRREHERAAIAQRSDPAARVSFSRVTLGHADLLQCISVQYRHAGQMMMIQEASHFPRVLSDLYIEQRKLHRRN